ncbi:MAG: hypothetical protein ACYCTL_08000 [Acidimicrobiales bacterium]
MFPPRLHVIEPGRVDTFRSGSERTSGIRVELGFLRDLLHFWRSRLPAGARVAHLTFGLAYAGGML